MLSKFAFVNRVVILEQDDTQMQKTLNHAMSLVAQSPFLKSALQNIKPALSQHKKTNNSEEIIKQYNLREETLLNQALQFQLESTQL